MAEWKGKTEADTGSQKLKNDIEEKNKSYLRNILYGK